MVASPENKKMKINKFLSWIITFSLIGCSSISAPVTTPTQPKNTSTLVVIQTITPESTESTQSSCTQTAVTQSDLNKCASQIAQATFSKLESLIDELQGRMNASQYAALLKIEADWERTSLEHCEWEASFFEGGSVRPMWLADCLNRQYLDRIEALRLTLCEGNGMTGECERSLKYKE